MIRDADVDQRPLSNTLSNKNIDQFLPLIPLSKTLMTPRKIHLILSFLFSSLPAQVCLSCLHSRYPSNSRFWFRHCGTEHLGPNFVHRHHFPCLHTDLESPLQSSQWGTLPDLSAKGCRLRTGVLGHVFHYQPHRYY